VFGDFNQATQFDGSNRLSVLERVVKIHGFAELVEFWATATEAAPLVDPVPQRCTKTAAPPTKNGYKPYGAI
jgi:hypothetical protein